MPRSRNLANYEAVFWDLLMGMRSGIPEINLTLPRKAAINTQQTYYAFIHALEHASNVKKIGGDVKHANELQNDANTMRGYIVVLKHEETISTLSFINRDLNPSTQSVREQIHEQLSKHQPVEEQDIEMKPVSDFFASTLTIKETDNES